ncbi:MAG: hypothetical protein FWB78_08110 [Treponema sp.]|nr:hypothetical protein [Treponema sp.]
MDWDKIFKNTRDIGLLGLDLIEKHGGKHKNENLSIAGRVVKDICNILDGNGYPDENPPKKKKRKRG